jgi:hemerythrin-like metal-binding protein
VEENRLFGNPRVPNYDLSIFLRQLKIFGRMPIFPPTGFPLYMFRNLSSEARMALIKWDPSYSVKVNRCDNDHKKLFSLINSLHEAMLAGKAAVAIQQVVRELADYAKSHFAAEEALLEKAKYPALSSHRAEHQAFVKRVEKFQQDLAAGESGQSIAVVTFLNEWLSHHIKQTDQQYSAHLNAHGVS